MDIHLTLQLVLENGCSIGFRVTAHSVEGLHVQEPEEDVIYLAPYDKEELSGSPLLGVCAPNLVYSQQLDAAQKPFV